MPISVGHFRSGSPSSLVKMWAGSPSTLPPPSAPRMAVHQPYLAKASVSLRAHHVGRVHPGVVVVRHRLGLALRVQLDLLVVELLDRLGVAP